MVSRHPCVAFLALTMFMNARAATVTRITEENWREVAPHGKEADWIYGDFVLRNEHLVAVIAQPTPSRNANMTVRNVAGALIDLTFCADPDDQLSCFYPGGALMPLTDATARADNGDAVLICSSEPHADGPQVSVEYRLAQSQKVISVTSTFTNPHAEPIEFELQDAIRADKGFEHTIHEESNAYWCQDLWWHHVYCVLPLQHKIAAVADSLERGRPVLSYAGAGSTRIKLQPGRSYELRRFVFPARNTVAARTMALTLTDPQPVPRPLTIIASDAAGPVAHALVTVFQGDAVYGKGLTMKGRFEGALPPGEFRAQVHSLERGMTTVELRAGEVANVELPLPGYVKSVITDEAGRPLPAKVQFRGKGVADPFFGTDTMDFGVHNLQYTADGRFTTAISPGTYEVIISRGTEYDADVQTITVRRGETKELTAILKHAVQTDGWVSTDFHSHSSPSGDNTSSQLGRVLNLLAEHIEFAPCTEHNRISSYVPHLTALDAASLMATCSGIELTGQPLPVNHQNAFPLRHHPHTQDGGGPQADENPILQIERLAMWDNGAEKLLQENHPNLEQIWADRDLDGIRDDGFARMIGYMDVVEVHPPADIFAAPGMKTGLYRNVVFSWIRMLNMGYRIPGVVNTDAHYNFHGSGWLRNYVKSSTDDPAKIDVMEMVHETEHGHVIMTNGPFLEVSMRNSAGDDALPGDDLAAGDGKTKVWIRIQCPNWLDVNRVQIFLNGRPDENLGFTRRTTPKRFNNGVVKFDETVELQFDKDTHVIVATIGQGLKLGSVMGPQYGEDAPVAMSNPIFVDVDGGGFQPNKDLLGQPLPYLAP